MQKTIKLLIEIIVFFLILIFILLAISPIFVPKWLNNDDNMMTYITKGFYEEKRNSLDVIYLGNSDLYRGISPITIWDEYGITSYAYTTPGQVSWMSYYTLLETLRFQNPKVVIFDVDACNSSFHSSEGNYRKAFDNMRLSLNKINALNDEAFEFTFIEKLSYIFPVIKYHSRLLELTDIDFEYAYNNSRFAYKGLDMIAEIGPYSNGFDYMEDLGEDYMIPEKTKIYLDKMVEECKKRDIDLILIEIPSAVSWNYAKSQTFKKYAEENSIKFIDFNLLGKEIGFDWEKDSSDGGDHLNVYGAEKISKYIGKYLNYHYDFLDKRNLEEYEYWNVDSKKYHEDRKQMILDVQSNS